MASQKAVPALSDLPLREGDPPNSAWGLWKDTPELGALNHLTDEVVLEAVKSEIKTGERVGLKYVISTMASIDKIYSNTKQSSSRSV